MTDKPMMKCGCAAAGTRMRDGAPVCITHDCDEVVETPDLTGRTAYCFCGATKESSTSLPFFVLDPKGDGKDRFYCGCMGWD